MIDELTVIVGQLGYQEKVLIVALCCLIAIAYAINRVQRFRTLAEATRPEDDPYYIILNEPVGVGLRAGTQDGDICIPRVAASNPIGWTGERRRDRLFRMIDAGQTCSSECIIPSIQIPKALGPQPMLSVKLAEAERETTYCQPVLDDSIMSAPLLLKTPLAYAPIVERIVTVTQNPETVISSKQASSPRSIHEDLRAPSARVDSTHNYSTERMALPVYTAVAEADFLRSMTSEDARRLKRQFGFVCVPHDSWDEAKRIMEDKSWADAFVKVKVEDDEFPYLSVAYAKASHALVLSDSANIRRLCERESIPCASMKDWRAGWGVP